MLLAGAILGNGVCILVNTGATHNVHITTTMLIGSGMELSYQGACFTTPLRINGETFPIDAFLLPIGDDIDIILGALWLTDISNTLWNFASLQMQFQRDDRTVTFTSIPYFRAPDMWPTATSAPPAPAPAPMLTLATTPWAMTSASTLRAPVAVPTTWGAWAVPPAGAAWPVTLAPAWVSTQEAAKWDATHEQSPGQRPHGSSPPRRQEQ